MTGQGGASVLDILCPMHLVINATGHITHAGPTARKLAGDSPMVGARFLEVFAVNRPRAVASMADLRRSGGTKLHLETRAAPRTRLKAVLVPLPEGEGKMIVNLSFGISIVDGVRDYALSNADFAATDLAIEMLYLIEAKTAAMDESRRLNLRLQGAKIAAEQEADTDALTGLGNRRALNNVLTRMVAGRVPFAVMQIDLDYFKSVNDTLGHAAGDHVLQTVAQIMVEETRNKDTVARVGGDEFTVVLVDVRDADILRRVGRRIIDRLEEPIAYSGHLCRISASIGTVWIQSGISPAMEKLMDDADVALYASKHAGRARQTIYDPSLRETAGQGAAQGAGGQQPA
ncbi:GGDEF domain-containing protein [Sulfitobacter sp. G21635-S1]|uniref:GGDEF domain-containing protein n=2 Tax=unclassified Sulfitobacter TaxID=196795 RepID=UPI0022AE854C|nr:GGDEF domain-containing protein [Sulfitobacter sp. G21635-S1]